jgi:hypothetical protein
MTRSSAHANNGLACRRPATRVSLARFFDSGRRPVQDRRMQLVMRNIADTCVRCGNRRALEGKPKRSHSCSLTAQRSVKVVAQCEDELALIEARRSGIDLRPTSATYPAFIKSKSPQMWPSSTLSEPSNGRNYPLSSLRFGHSAVVSGHQYVPNATGGRQPAITPRLPPRIR